MSSMEEGVLVVDSAGRVRMANDAVRSMFGIEESPVDRHYLELVRHPEISRQVGRALEHGAVDSFEAMLGADPPRVFLVSIAHLDPETDTGGGAVVVIHDITRYRRTEQVREDFVANVSHELRTPLTAVRGAVDALVDTNDPADSTRFLAIIDRNTARMERLVSDLLRLVRLDAGQEPLDIAPFSLISLFRGVQTELAPLLASNRQTLDTKVLGPDTALVDPVKLHDVVKNLVENALHYAPPDSTIRAACRSVGRASRIDGERPRTWTPRVRFSLVSSSASIGSSSRA